MKMDEIIKHLSIAMDGIEKISSDDTKGNKNNPSSQDYDRIRILALKNPFTGHVLAKENEMIQELYIAALLSLVSDESNDVVRNQYLLTIGRMIASFDKEVDFSKYMTKYMKIDRDFWSDFASFIKDDVANSFAVDALLLGNSTTEPTKDVYENIVDVLQLLGITPNNIKRLAAITKSIIKQDFQEMLNVLRSQTDIKPNYFRGYFAENKFDHISTDLVSCKAVSGKLLVANGVFKNMESIIDLDKFAAAEISFVNCNFTRIRGFVSLRKKVTFNGCTFEANILNVSEKRGLLGTYKETEKDTVFFKGNNVEIINSKFLNCSVSKNLIVLENGSIQNCIFKNCNGTELPCTYLLQLKRVDVGQCTFNECCIETDNASRRSTSGGIAFIENGSASYSVFEKCTVYGNSGYGRFAHYNMQILRAANSKIEKCHFNNCCCNSCDSSDKDVYSYILGLSNSQQVGNKFNDCSSYHYRYSERLGSQDVGDIREDS